MKNSLVEKYTYKVEWSEEDGVHVASCLELPSLFAHGSSVLLALSEIQKVVAETIKWMQEEGEVIPEPFSIKHYKGNLTLRVPKTIHKRLAMKSAEEGVSINQYILTKIS